MDDETTGVLPSRDGEGCSGITLQWSTDFSSELPGLGKARHDEF